MRSFIFGLFLFSLVSCGMRESISQSSKVSSTVDYDVTEDLANVAFTLSGTPSLTPSTPPASTETITSLVVSFSASIDRTQDMSFSYAKSKWRLGFQSYDGTGSIVELSAAPTVEGTEAISGSVATVSVTLTASLSSGLPVDVKTLISNAESATSRRQVKLVAIYRDGTTAASSDRYVKMTWAADRGVIVSGPTISVPTVSDQTLVASWQSPSDLSAVMRNSDGSTEDAGDSTVSAYVLVYWNLASCGATGAQWNWSSNSELDASSASTQLSTCSYAASSAAQYSTSIATSACSLGCDTTTSSTYSGKSPEDVATPAFVPTSAQTGTVFEVGCYNVVRIAKQTSSGVASFSIPDLTNGERYGMMVYLVDSSGHLSLGRSACAFGEPVPVPLPADGKTGGASKTRSDCFVATAASGSVNSRSVHYWRVIRDTFLRDSAFVSWYYRNGPRMAGWLDNHAWLKPPLDFALEKSGQFIVSTRYFLRDVASFAKNAFGVFLAGLEQFFVSTAHGETPESEDLTSPFLQPVDAYFSVLGTKLGMTTDKPTWEAYFRAKNKPKDLYAISFAGGYSLWSGAYGALSGVLQGTYFGATGEVPTVLPSGAAADSRVAGTEHVSTMMMASVGADVRLRVPHPYVYWLAPRVSYFEGYARMRLEPRVSAAMNTQNTEGWPVGYTLMKRVSVLRYGVDVMFGRVFYQEVAEAQRTLGLSDMGFQVFAESWDDKSNSLSVSSNGYGAGMVFQF